MKAKKYYFFYILLLTVLACNNIKKADKDSMVIKGSFFNANGAYVYLEELTIDELKLLDSAKVKNDGSFSFRVKPEHSGFYILKLNDNNFVTLLGEKEKQFLLLLMQGK